jgi:hypothetical protein
VTEASSPSSSPSAAAWRALPDPALPFVASVSALGFPAPPSAIARKTEASATAAKMKTTKKTTTTKTKKKKKQRKENINKNIKINKLLFP